MFRIDADDLSWINGSPDDPSDHCLHGHAVAKVGERTLEYNATVSATALYLLKSLTEDHIAGKDLQMLPCCGFSIYADDDLQNVTIVGCNSGIDWSVLHEGDEVRIVLEDGYSVTVPHDEYRREVFAFADKIEAFYDACSPKEDREDEFEQAGYTAFWREWHKRRDAHSPVG